MAGPMQRAAVTDTTTEGLKNAWSHARDMDPPHVPWCPGTDRTTPSKASPSDRRAANHTEGAAEPGVGAVDGSERGLPRRKREVNPTQAQQRLAWLRRAPQGRAPSGSGGKRRALVSGIRLATSLEETKRKGAR